VCLKQDRKIKKICLFVAYFVGKVLSRILISLNMNASTAWAILFVAGLFETGWAIGLKYSEGFTRLWPSVITVVSMAISVWLLSLSLKVLPVGSAYAVWTGIGATLTAILGVILFQESREVLKILFILMIVAGIVGLRFVGK
jgi:quaternary ammonium compound-resistance protein SugE